MHPPIPHILVRAMTQSRSGSRYRPRAMSLESPKLIEALTIYEKLKKCQEEENEQEYEEEIKGQKGPHFSPRAATTSESETGARRVDLGDSPQPLEAFSPNFNSPVVEESEIHAYSKYKDLNFKDGNYIFYSADSGMIQAKTFDSLRDSETDMDYTELLHTKKYWLDVVCPTDNDLRLLSSAFRVHELTMRDIREGTTEEKMEMFNHYTFVSLKLSKDHLSSNSNSNSNNHKSSPPTNSSPLQKSFSGKEDTTEYLNIDVEKDTKTESTSTEEELSYDVEGLSQDLDLNILLFSDFVITVHKKSWENVKDILGFLSILYEYGNTQPLPEWVLFSIFVELAQDAKKALKGLTPNIMNMRAAQIKQEGKIGVDVFKLSGLLRKNFVYEFELHKIYRFIKPKLQVLSTIQIKGRRRFSNVPGLIRFLANVGSEFDDLLDELDKLSRIVERSQDTFLALASVQQSVEANEMGEIMKKISEIAMIFLPIQAISGFLGMNVRVPFQEEESTFPFWSIVMLSVLIAMSLFIGRRLIFCGRKYCANKIMENEGGKCVVESRGARIKRNLQSFVKRCRNKSKECT